MNESYLDHIVVPLYSEIIAGTVVHRIEIQLKWI
jgi:hypothetical protein